MGLLPAASTRSNGATITAASFNSDFAAIKTWADAYVLHTDVAKSVSAIITFSTSPAFPAAVTFALGATITAGGMTVTAGGLTITAGGLTVTAGASSFGADVGVTGTVTATEFSGGGAGLTGLAAAAFTSGTFGAVNGSNLTNLNATALASGTVAAARLPSAIDVSTRLSAPAIQASGSSNTAILKLLDNGTEFLEIGASSATWVSSGSTPAGAIKYLAVKENGTIYYIRMQAA